jgi:hypothetical protein
VLWLAAASIVFLLLAAGAEYWRVQRELGAVAAQRDAQQAEVGVAYAQRNRYMSRLAQSDRLAAFERSASNWAEVVGVVARQLPRNAYLTSFEANADSVILRGYSEKAVTVYEQLREAPQFVAVRASAPILREQTGSGAAIERFSILVHFRSTQAPGEGNP